MGALGLSNDSGKARHPLPHPPVSLAIFLTLEAAMAEAWRRIHESPKPPFNPATALEADFTAEMHEVLRDELLEEESVPGFSKDIFHGVVRPEVKNFNGTKVGKRPDMMASLSRPSWWTRRTPPSCSTATMASPVSMMAITHGP
jgi:hypothetical protein